MTTARVKTWSAEVLGYADLNAEFDNLVDDINTVDGKIPTITSAAETVLDDLSTSVMRTTLGVGYGTGATTVCVGNDARLSDTRVPTDDSVTQAKIGTAAVGIDEMKVLLGEASTTDVNGQSITVTGGLFAFMPQLKASAGNTVYWGRDSAGASTGAAAWSTSTSFATLINLSTSAGTGYAQWNYIVASPPYDLGDGEVNGFIYLKFDVVTGAVVSVTIAEDPPWYGNVPRSTDKLKGMDKIPHPFGAIKKGHKVFMVDPMSNLVRELILMRGEGADVAELFYSGKIQLIKPVKRSMPPGVVAYKCKWK